VFRPNNKCLLSRPAGRDLFSKPRLTKPVRVPCSIVKLETTALTTSVRADSSASRGAAEQQEAAAVILFPTTVKVAINYVLTVSGVQIRVTKVVPRFNVAGKLDHIEVAGVIQELAT